MEKIQEQNKNMKNLEISNKEKQAEIEKYKDKILKYENTVQSILNDRNKYDDEINKLIDNQIQNNSEIVNYFF